MQTQVLQSSYTGGMIQDVPRHMLPPGSAWTITDFIPGLDDAPLQKRGGWAASNAIGAGAKIYGISWAPFTTGTRIIAIDNAGNLTKSTDGITFTAVGAAIIPKSRPVFFNNKLVICDAANTPKTFDGTTIANLTTPVIGAEKIQVAAAYKSRLVVATPSTVFFSAPLDETTWDINSFVKTTDPITAIVPLSNMIAIFSSGRSERLRGATPPSTTSDGDMTLEPMFEEGCIDPRSVVVHNDQMIWANLNGVHISDGAATVNLIEIGGLKQWWDTLMIQYNSNWVFAGGRYGGYYILSIVNTSLGGVQTLMCNLQTKRWTFLGNTPVLMFAESYGATPELYMALNSTNKVGRFAQCFDPNSSTTDGDGTAVTPSIEYPFFRPSTGSSRWLDLFLSVEFASVSGHLEVSYTRLPNSPDYDIAGGADPAVPILITDTGGFARVRLPVRTASNGLGIKIAQVGAGTKTAIFDLEARVRMREGRY